VSTEIKRVSLKKVEEEARKLAAKYGVTDVWGFAEDLKLALLGTPRTEPRFAELPAEWPGRR
jgi:hypothetical protein